MTATDDSTITRQQREQWVDTLRVVLIAGVIVVHTATGYVADFAGFYYDDERVANTVVSIAFALPALLGGIFGLGPLFVVAGWFSVRSLRRRGPTGFVGSRLLRLGVPLLFFVMVVNPLADYLGNQWDEDADFVATRAKVWLSEPGRRKAIGLFEARLDESWKHPVLGYSLSYARTLELEARLLEKEWSGEPGLFARSRLR